MKRVTGNGVFRLTEIECETDKKWVVWECVEMFLLTKTDTKTDVNGFQTHFIGLGHGIRLCLCQYGRTINLVTCEQTFTTVPTQTGKTRKWEGIFFSQGKVEEF